MDSRVGLVRLLQNVWEKHDAAIVLVRSTLTTGCGFDSVDLDRSSSSTTLLRHGASQGVQLILRLSQTHSSLAHYNQESKCCP